MSSLLGILLFVFALMLAILFHEGGHFATAKLFGMKVERFFLGFGTTLWSFRRGETEYGIKALPLGGFCKIAGMSPYESDGNFLEEERPRRGRRSAAAASTTGTVIAGTLEPEAPKPAPAPPDRLFRNKPAWQRAIVLSAGSVTHFVVALVLIYAVLVGVGLSVTTTRIAEVVPTAPSGDQAPAAAAGLRAGDRVVAVDNRPVDGFEQLRAAFADKAGRPVTVTYERAGERRTTTLTPVAINDNGRVRGFLGVKGSVEKRRLGPVAGIGRTGSVFWSAVTGSVKGLSQIVPGLTQRLRSTAGPDTATGGGGAAGGGSGESGPIGIVGIARFAGEAVAANEWLAFLLLLIQFNVFVGLFNLLPIPPMDGGYLGFVAWEKLTRRTVDLRKVAPVAAGIVILLFMLTVSLIWLDITNPVANPFK
ncbi:MAG TPA: M50 family metallopeptidase [Actinomycetota bacterium]|nr:M50 family metallopeptidase [Actinomycetota bacterium]